MKAVPANLAAMLASGVTTLCRCWRVVRQDGQVYGFTDHDRELTFGGTVYAPETGFSAAEVETTLGLAIDTMEVAGALSSTQIDETDIGLGFWDNADVTIWIVDWTNVANRLLETRGSLGEIARGDLVFETEIRGLAHRLNQEAGRTYQRQCDAVLGDARCGVDLGNADFSGSGTVVAAADDRYLTVSGLESFASGFFAQGLLTWTSGNNEAASVELRGHAANRLTLWRAAAIKVQPGDTFDIVAGCDKSWAMCRERFSNGANFRGFPHIPGDDFALGTAKKDQVNDGGSFFR